MADTKSRALTPEEIAEQEELRNRKHQEELEEFYNAKVPIMVPKPEGVEAESITVTVNGRNTQILYDEEVMVPRNIALIIEESKKNKKHADAEARERAKTTQIADFS